MCRIDDDAQARLLGQVSGVSERVHELCGLVTDHEHLSSLSWECSSGLGSRLAGVWRRSVATEPVQSPPVLSRGVIPSLPVGIVDGHGHQRDRSDGTHLGFGEFADRSDPLHHTFDGSVVGNR
jgi:hypothetical protein